MDGVLPPPRVYVGHGHLRSRQMAEKRKRFDLSFSPSVASASSWSHFYGFDFSPVSSIAAASRLATPSVEAIAESQLLSEAQIVASFHLKTVHREDVASLFTTLEFEVEDSASSSSADSS